MYPNLLKSSLPRSSSKLRNCIIIFNPKSHLDVIYSLTEVNSSELTVLESPRDSRLRNVPYMVLLLAYLVRFRDAATYNESNNALECIRSWSCVTSNSLNMWYNALSVLVSVIGYRHSPLACTELVKFSNHPPTTTCNHKQYSY